MRSLFFLPECDYWVNNSNFLPVVLDNLIFFFVFYDSLRCKFTSYDQTSTVFDSRFSTVKLCFPSDLDQHKFSLEKIEDVLFILKKKKSMKDSVWIYDIWNSNSFMNRNRITWKEKNSISKPEMMVKEIDFKSWG